MSKASNQHRKELRAAQAIESAVTRLEKAGWGLLPPGRIEPIAPAATPEPGPCEFCGGGNPFDNRAKCLRPMSRGYACTRKPDHMGRCVACNESYHDILWSQMDNQPKPEPALPPRPADLSVLAGYELGDVLEDCHLPKRGERYDCCGIILMAGADHAPGQTLWWIVSRNPRPVVAGWEFPRFAVPVLGEHCMLPGGITIAGAGHTHPVWIAVSKSAPVAAVTVEQSGEWLGFAAQVKAELAKARAQHSPLNSLHEGYAVILEELDELWEHVRQRKESRDRGAILKELVQIGAMAQRLAEDEDHRYLAAQGKAVGK